MSIQEVERGGDGQDGAERSAVEGLLARTADLIDAWNDLDPDALSTGEVGALLIGHARQSARLEGAAMALAASFARREGYKASGHRNLQHWMQDVLRTAPSSAMRRARTVDELDKNLEQTGRALRDGDITPEHATAIAEAARKVPGDERAEQMLLGVARTGDAKQVRDTGRRLERRADEEAARQKSRRAWEQRHLNVRSGSDGVTWIDGRVYQLGGEILAAALADLSAPDGTDDERTPGQRRADALVELARRHVEGDTGRPSERPGMQLVGVVPLSEIEKRAGLEAGTLSWSGPGLPADLEAALCMSGLDWLITDTDQRPLHYGRDKRFAQPEQRAALQVRDGGCRWPGCGAKGHWMIVHHTPEWDAGGVTDIAFLVFLCPVHHNYVHHGRWTLSLHDDACVTVRSPAGSVLLTESAARARARHLHGVGLDQPDDLDCADHQQSCSQGVIAPGAASGGPRRSNEHDRHADVIGRSGQQGRGPHRSEDRATGVTWRAPVWDVRLARRDVRPGGQRVPQQHRVRPSRPPGRPRRPHGPPEIASQTSGRYVARPPPSRKGQDTATPAGAATSARAVSPDRRWAIGDGRLANGRWAIGEGRWTMGEGSPHACGWPQSSVGLPRRRLELKLATLRYPSA
jgi:hypothetical protein